MYMAIHQDEPSVKGVDGRRARVDAPHVKEVSEQEFGSWLSNPQGNDRVPGIVISQYLLILSVFLYYY